MVTVAPAAVDEYSLHALETASRKKAQALRDRSAAFRLHLARETDQRRLLPESAFTCQISTIRTTPYMPHHDSETWVRLPPFHIHF
jgi:hypothetical protein